MDAKSVFSIALCLILSNFVISTSVPGSRDTGVNDDNVRVRWWNTVSELSDTHQVIKRSAASANEEKNKTICNIPGCSCQHDKHPVWITVNCSFDNKQDVDLTAEFLPETAIEVTLSGAGRVRALARAFTALVDLGRLRVQDTDVILFAKDAFLNLTSLNLRLEVLSCGSVHFETSAFKNLKGAVTVNISQCNEVYLGKESFSKPILISISHVPQLELGEGAFVFVAGDYHHGAVAKIHFNNVSVADFPRNTFGSSANEIYLQMTDVKKVHRHAFNANTIIAVIAINSSFHQIMEEAFAQKTLIQNLEFYNCTINMIESRALLSSATNLTIKHSSINEVSSEAIDVTLATATITDNDFGKIHSRGFELKSWNKMLIERNFFNKLEENAFICPPAARPKHENGNEKEGEYLEFTFIENAFLSVDKGSLNFISNVQHFINPIVYNNNFFADECYCGINNWLYSVFDNNSSQIESIANKSYCSVKKNIAVCFNVNEGNMLVKNFTEQVCGSLGAINCEPSTRNTKGPVGEVINTRFHNRTNKFEDDKRAENTNKKIVWSILIISVCGIVIIITYNVIAWGRRKGYCTNAANAVMSSNSSCGTFCDRLFNINYGIDTAGSISRVPINDYTESHRLNEMRTLYIEDTPAETDPSLEILVDMADKGTQTLPEELTQDLLESLRMKLDIPETYEEAREMIEHLYDLITVEEYCNANINNSTSANKAVTPREEQDDLYDVIQVPQRTPVRSGRNKERKSVGTRTPSLDKLVPFSPYTRPTALSHEYFEPRDCAIHLYSQLPDDKTAKIMPDVLTERPTSRPLSFLRVIGEKLYDNNPKAPPENQPSTSGFFPFGAGGTQKSNKSSKSSGSSSSANKMANRPLPAKPGDPGEGTSFLKR